jgi:hypothetical protein
MKVQVTKDGHASTAEVFISHMEPEEFLAEFPYLDTGINISKKKTKKVTVAEVIFDGASSTAVSVCHKNDDFRRHKGSSSALSRALKQHPNLRQREAKDTRRQIFEQMFRSEPSPYAELEELIKGRPELVRKLIAVARENS